MNTDSLEGRISAIEKRNRRVEQDKQWEISWTRKILLVFMTYITLGLYFNYILQVNPWLNALVPTTGFWLSTLSLPIFRKLWERYLKK